MRRFSIVFGLLATAAAPVSAGAGVELLPALAANVLQVQVQAVDAQARSAPMPEPRGWLGINVRLESDSESGTGIRVVELSQDGPAHAAGLRVGDRVVEVNGIAASPERFVAAVEGLRPGAPISFTVIRDGGEVVIAIEAGSRPDESTRILRVAEGRLDSARAVFETRIRSTPESVRGVFFSSPTDSSISVRLEPATAPETGRLWLTDSTATRWTMRSTDGGASFDVTIDLADAAEGTPLAALVRADSAQQAILRERMEALRDQIAGASSRAARTMREQEAEFGRLRELERRLAESQVRVEAGAPVAVDVLGEAVLIDTPEPGGVLTIRRPLAPYLTGLNRIAGAELQAMNPELGSYFGTERGLLVVEVSEGSPAAETGLLAGDVILAVNGEEVETIDEMRKRLVTAGEGWTLTVTRRGRTLELGSR